MPSLIDHLRGEMIAEHAYGQRVARIVIGQAGIIAWADACTEALIRVGGLSGSISALLDPHDERIVPVVLDRHCPRMYDLEYEADA